MKRSNDAAICRTMAWGPGTLLKGRHGVRGEFVIKITSIGRSAVLARRHGAAEVAGWDLEQSGVTPATQEEYRRGRILHPGPTGREVVFVPEGRRRRRAVRGGVPQLPAVAAVARQAGKIADGIVSDYRPYFDPESPVMLDQLGIRIQREIIDLYHRLCNVPHACNRAPVSRGPIVQAMGALRRAVGNAWDGVEDPESFLRQQRVE